MSTIHGASEIGPATARRQYDSLLKACWDAFREWRQRERLRAQLCRLTDGELMDIGIARGEIDHIAANYLIDPQGAVLAVNSPDRFQR